MKKLLIGALSLTLSTNALSGKIQGRLDVIYQSDFVYAFKFTDEFTGEVNPCRLAIFDHNVHPELGLFLTTHSDGHRYISASVENHEASGFKFRIDDGDIVEKGRTSAGGEFVLMRLHDDDLLDELSAGKEITIRAHPSNLDANSITKTISLKGSAVAVSKFRECVKELRE